MDAILFAVEMDWIGLLEKGGTSGMMAIAFGWVLEYVGQKLLESHMKLVDNANNKMDAAVGQLNAQTAILTNIATTSDEQAKMWRKWPSDPITICKAHEVHQTIKPKKDP